ncbi:Pectinesterase protein [Dioscorea alata]|uniref:Pectinesterase protein n=1 Tax=Dioscorea alata TaxID=55571 RepID=A0ACB7V045_DIOAL|nr:Pectinesterase protein [Dioscorea alata]
MKNIIMLPIFLLFILSYISSKSIFVDQSGHGDFTTIAAAIDAIPSNNNQWIRIHVKAGVYTEKVQIGNDKGFILLEGEGYEQTSVEWGDHTSGGNETDQTSTFRFSGNNIVVKYISFKNTFNGGSQLGQAVAALVEGDMISFYDSGFYGIQDTLCDFRGRHYYKDSYIQGAVDFIWGSAQSIYEGCNICSYGEGIDHGYITAQGRGTDSGPGGFVFKSCNVTGSLETFLGRAWTPYSMVIFYQTFMFNIVFPQGWDAFNAAGGKESLTYYVEFECSGPGSNTSERVNWVKKPTYDQLKQYIDISFIDKEGWLSQQP